MFNDQFDWYDNLQEKKIKIYRTFLQSLTNRSCCHVCECVSCDALQVMRDVDKLHDEVTEKNK